MKYPNWNEYDASKKWKAVAEELSLETNNATTKADLTNMVKFLGQEAARLQKVADAARVLSDIWSVGGKPNLSNLRYALAELDKAKEGQE